MLLDLGVMSGREQRLETRIHRSHRWASYERITGSRCHLPARRCVHASFIEKKSVVAIFSRRCQDSELTPEARRTLSSSRMSGLIAAK